jgi:hypothetical protein
MPLLKMLLDDFGNPKRIRAVSRWIAARVRGTPLCQTERDLIRQEMRRRIARIRERTEASQTAH